MKDPESYDEKPPVGGDPVPGAEPGAGARRLRNRYAAAAALLALASVYGLFLDQRIRPDPFSDSPGLWAWFSHKIPHPALQKIPVVPVGTRGTLTFRPKQTIWTNSPYLPGGGPGDGNGANPPAQSSFLRDLLIRGALAETGGSEQQIPPKVQLPDPTPSVGARPDGDAILDARCLPDGEGCWIGGEAGRLAVTSDGGATWQEIALGDGSADVWSLGGEPDASTLTALLSNWQDFKSSDGGLNWSQGDDGIWAEGQPFALGSGLVWLPVIPPLDVNQRVGSRRLTRPPSGAVASVAIPLDGARRFPTPGSDQAWQTHSASTGDTGGRRGVLGERLIEVATESGAVNINALLGVAAAPETEDKMWLLGDRGFLAKLITAPGASEASDAVSVETGTLANLRDIYFQDDKIGWASSGWYDENEEGERPAILQTLDGGATWQRLTYGHLPAPWSFAAALAFAFALFGTANAQIAYLRAPKPRLSIADQAAPDDPIGWEDVDALGLKRIARALSKFLRNRNTDPSVVFGISGPWGTGKSSLMNLVADDLKEVGCRPVAFNAWHHQKEEHLLAALLENIRAQGIPSWWRLSGLGFRLHLFFQRFLGDLKDTLALAAIAALAAATLWLISEPEVFTEAAKSLPALLEDLPSPYREIIGTLGFAGGGGVGLYLLLRAALRLRALPASPAALLASFARHTKVAAFQQKLSFRYNFGREFGQVCKALRNNPLDPYNPGMVIFIDDLDRCRPENVLDVLEAVNFLATAGPCFIFLGIDEEKVISSVAHGFKDSVLTLQEEEPGGSGAGSDAGQDGAAEDEERAKALLQPDAVRLSDFARNYLEKLINITVPVPPATASATAALLNARLPGDPNADGAQGTDSSEDSRPISPWPRRLRRFVRGAFDVAGVVVPAAILLAFVIDVRMGEGDPGNPSEPGAAQESRLDGGATESAESDEAGGATDPTGTQGNTAPAPDKPKTPDRIPADELEDRAAWLVFLLLAIPIIVLAFAILLRVLGRREDLIEDTEDFRLALGAWNQVIFTANPTPRGVKRYQNRLRFLAMRARGDDSPLDWIERVCRRLGLRVRDVEASEEGRIGDLELVTLGAIEAHDQGLLDLSPAEIDSRFRQHLDDVAGEEVHIQFPPDQFRSLVGAWPPREKAVESYREYSRSLIARTAAPATKIRESA